jgi:hypothetical protein
VVAVEARPLDKRLKAQCGGRLADMLTVTAISMFFADRGVNVSKHASLIRVANSSNSTNQRENAIFFRQSLN